MWRVEDQGNGKASRQPGSIREEQTRDQARLLKIIFNNDLFFNINMIAIVTILVIPFAFLSKRTLYCYRVQ